MLAIGLTTILIIYNSSDNKEKVIVKNVVTDFLTKYKNLDGSCAHYLLMNITGRDMTFEGIPALFAEQIEFKIKNVKKEEDYYIVKTEIQNVDYENLLKRLENGYSDKSDFTSEQVYALTLAELSKPDIVKRNFSCDIIVARYGDEYRIQMTPDLSNATLGGYNEYLTKKIEEGLQQ